MDTCQLDFMRLFAYSLQKVSSKMSYPDGLSRMQKRIVDITRLCISIFGDEWDGEPLSFVEEGFIVRQSSTLPMHVTKTWYFEKSRQHAAFSIEVTISKVESCIGLSESAADALNPNEFENTMVCAEELLDDISTRYDTFICTSKGKGILIVSEPITTNYPQFEEIVKRPFPSNWMGVVADTIEQRAHCSRCERAGFGYYQRVALQLERIPLSLVPRRVFHCSRCQSYVAMDEGHVQVSRACTHRDCKSVIKGGLFAKSALNVIQRQLLAHLRQRLESLPPIRFVRFWDNDDGHIHVYGYRRMERQPEPSIVYHQLPDSVYDETQHLLMQFENANPAQFDQDVADEFIRSHLHLFDSMDNVVAIRASGVTLCDESDDGGELCKVLRDGDGNPTFCLALYVVDRRWAGSAAKLHGHRLCKGIKVDIRQAFISNCGRGKAPLDLHTFASRPLQVGASVFIDYEPDRRRMPSSWGTIGAILVDSHQTRWALTCEHVLREGSDECEVHEAMLQRDVSVMYTVDTTNEFPRVKCNDDVKTLYDPSIEKSKTADGKAIVTQRFDVAVLKLPSDCVAGPEIFLKDPAFIEGSYVDKITIRVPTRVKYGDIVYKVGATTAVTKGCVGGLVLVTDELPVYPKRATTHRNFFSEHIYIESRVEGPNNQYDRFAGPGDSGAMGFSPVSINGAEVIARPAFVLVSTVGIRNAIAKPIIPILEELEMSVYIRSDIPTENDNSDEMEVDEH